MYFIKSLFIGASLVIAALAQSQLSFTSVPTSVKAGVPTVLKWSGGDETSPVTIILKKGDPQNLDTIATITSTATGGSFTWTPSKSLADGDDYAFQISQGTSQPNYSGPFTLSGGSSGSESSSAASSASKTSASKSSASAASITSSLSSIISSISSVASANNTHTTTTVAPINSTSLIHIGTGIGTAASSGGTGIPISRNTTLVHPTLKSSSTKTATTTSTGPASTEASGTGAGAGTGTSSSASGSGTKAPSSAANLASPLAFVITAFVAIIFLG